jgi:hypothetical protein
MAEKRKSRHETRVCIRFEDGLRGYRLAAELRTRFDPMDLGVRHDHSTVVLEFPERWTADPGFDELVGRYGGVAEPLTASAGLRV